MSRLNHMQGYELAIQAVSQELNYLERYLASGSEIACDDLQDLGSCLERLQQIVDGFQQRAAGRWQEDQEPLPAWLKPGQDAAGLRREDGEEPGSAVA